MTPTFFSAASKKYMEQLFRAPHEGFEDTVGAARLWAQATHDDSVSFADFRACFPMYRATRVRRLWTRMTPDPRELSRAEFVRYAARVLQPEDMGIVEGVMRYIGWV
jgi:hypothetical protein